MIEIHSSDQQNGEIVVYAEVMGESIVLYTFPAPFDKEFIAGFKDGAEALAKALEGLQPTPAKVAQMAHEAARAAGVDESTIRQGGVAVGPWGAVSVPGDTEDEYDDCHPIYE